MFDSLRLLPNRPASVEQVPSPSGSPSALDEIREHRDVELVDLDQLSTFSGSF